jgi:predicted aconitase with swiveling domain
MVWNSSHLLIYQSLTGLVRHLPESRGHSCGSLLAMSATSAQSDERESSAIGGPREQFAGHPLPSMLRPFC